MYRNSNKLADVSQGCATRGIAHRVRIRTRLAGMDAARLAHAASCRLRAKIESERGQGTTEYAILVGVLVVIAIIAIALFRPRLEELWNAIADGINSL